MFTGLGTRMWRAARPRRRRLAVVLAAAAALAVVAVPSSALEVNCSPNPSGGQTCHGTDTFNYAGPGMPGQGCPPAGYTDTLTIDEEVTQGATNVTGTWGNDPTAICGGLTDTSGTPYKQGDMLRGGAFKLDSSGHHVVGPKNGWIWEWTVKVPGTGAGGDHPQVVVNVSYDRPPPSTGGGGNGGGNTGGGSTGSNGSGVCDWSVSFDKPPKRATSAPVGYHLIVHNAGTGPCQGILRLESDGGDATSLANLVAGAPGPYADNATWFIRGLGPGASDDFDVLAKPKVANLGRTGNRIRLRASLSPDADSPNGTDEFATVRTRLKPKPIDLTGGQTDGHGHGTLTVDCPAGEHKHDRCVFNLDIAATPLPQDLLLFPPLGSAHGTVPAGFEGKIDFGLPFTERKQLAKHHKMQVTFVGTRTEDGKSTLVEGRVTLKQ